MNNYCIYLRKSRADIEVESCGDGETLARHERALTDLAKRLNFKIKSIYKEIISGETISARPVMQKLLTEVEQGLWDGVFVMEVERLARGNTIDQGIVAQTFKFSDTKIITPMKTFDPNNEFDEEYFEFGLFMSRREYKTINRRLQRGRVASVKEGKYVANQPPYGYNRKKIVNEKGFTLEPNVDESNIIKLIFNLYTQGEMQNDGTYRRLGTGLIANKLNSMQVPAKKGGFWVPSSIRDILINPVYIGQIRWNWRPVTKKMVNGKIIIERPRSSIEDCIIVKGIHPAIIEEKVYVMAQEYISRNPPCPIGQCDTIKNPLAGLIVCGECGRKMVRRSYPKSKNQPDTIMCTAKTCNNISSSLHYVEDRILQGLEKWLSGYKLDWNISENKQSLDIQINTKKNAIKKIEKELIKIDRQINTIHDLLECGEYSRETFLNRSEINFKKADQLRKNKSTIENELNLEINMQSTQKTMIPKPENILETYKYLETPPAKNDMLKQIIEKVIYTKEKGGRWHSDPYNFKLSLYPKLPNSTHQ